MAILCHNVVPHYHHDKGDDGFSIAHFHHSTHSHTHQHPHTHSHEQEREHYHYHYHYHTHGNSHYHSHPTTESPVFEEHFSGSITNYLTGLDFVDYQSYFDKITQSIPIGAHSHGFPWHHHISPFNDFNYLRTAIKCVSASPDFSLWSLYGIYEVEKPHVPFSELRRWQYDYPFLIFSCFEPGATSLRGPPSVA